MILERLKLETSIQHEGLERKLNLLSPDFTRASYRVLLEKFLGFYEPLEAKLLAGTGLDKNVFDLALRQKTPSLKRDLEALGLTDQQIQDLPRSTQSELPKLNLPEHCAGCLYVLEGATLGGQIISKHLTALLGIGPSTGGEFFMGYGNQTGLKWREFRTFCESYTATCQTPDAIILGAQDTFQKFEAWTCTSST